MGKKNKEHELVTLSKRMGKRGTIRGALRAERERTAVGPQALLRDATDAPDDLKPKVIEYWLSERARTARRDHVEYALARWKELPTREYVDMTTEALQTLKDHEKRTGVGATALLSGRKDIPDDLYASTIRSWLNGRVKSARVDHLDYVLSLWARLKDTQSITLTATMRRQIRTHIKRTGIGAGRVLRGCGDIPDGLRSSIVLSWLADGRKNVDRKHWDFVMRLYENAPAKDDVTETITPRLLARLKLEQERTGIGATRLLKGLSNVPPGLTAQVVNGWLAGRTRTAKREHFDFAMARWKSLPDRQGTARKDTRTSSTDIRTYDRVPIDPGILRELQALRASTAIGPAVLLKGAPDIPAGLKPHTVSMWLSGTVKTAQKDHLSYVLKRWRKWPDR